MIYAVQILLVLAVGYGALALIRGGANAKHQAIRRVVGLAFLLLTVVSLILTMDKTLNHIWRVQRMRPLGQRLLI